MNKQKIKPKGNAQKYIMMGSIQEEFTSELNMKEILLKDHLRIITEIILIFLI